MCKDTEVCDSRNIHGQLQVAGLFPLSECSSFRWYRANVKTEMYEGGVGIE